MGNENEETNETTETKPTITIAEKNGPADSKSKDTITIAEKNETPGKP